MSTLKSLEWLTAVRIAEVPDIGDIIMDLDLDFYSKAKLFTNCLPTELKESARRHYFELVMKEGAEQGKITLEIAAQRHRMRELGLARSLEDGFNDLPPYSVGIVIPFRLDRSYLSRDDDVFYIIDNPIKKEWVFKVPYVTSLTWKGSLRAAATRILAESIAGVLDKADEARATDEDLCRMASKIHGSREQHMLLFGNENSAQEEFINSSLVRLQLPKEPDAVGEQRDDRPAALQRLIQKQFQEHLVKRGVRTERVEGRQGRLHFFPTYFDRIGLEIINPHDRKRRVGTNPILMECVPAGTESHFQVLYTPFDFPGIGPEPPPVTPDEATLRRQLAEDLPLLARAIRRMLQVDGFGAKTSSGYGTAGNSLPKPGQVLMKLDLAVEEIPWFPLEKLAQYMTDEDSPGDLFRADGTPKSEEEYRQNLESKGLPYGKRKRQRLYREFMRAWESGGRTAFEKTRHPQPSGFTARSFSTLDELLAVTQRMSSQVGTGGSE
jgi:CRISPR/Cas system CMR subunit Cmr6 (Cas7 group RAMP superfamily)